VGPFRRILPICTSWLLAAAVSGADVPLPAHASSSVPEILLSRQLMEDAGVRVGDVVTLAVDSRESRSTQFKVVGIYEPTPDPMRFSARRLDARLHLPDLLALAGDPADPLSGETVGALNIALVNPQDASKIVALLATRALGLEARPTATSTEEGEVFAVINRFHWAIAIVTVVGSTAFLLALMVIRAEERRDIVGILRLMGVPPRSILVEVLLEGLLIAFGGAIFGIIIAALGQGAVNRFFQWRYDTTLRFVSVTMRIACQSVAFAVPLGVTAGLAASWTLLRRDVIALIRR
jgi:ABC-type lipoprotein release transport system permease subunit